MDAKTKKAELIEYYLEEISRRSPPKNQEDHFMINGYRALIQQMSDSMRSETGQLPV